MNMAYVNHGRWLVVCKHCGGKHIIKPPNKALVCIACSGKSSVVYPENWHDGFEVLRLRHLKNMNWLPGETVEDLRAENIAHGVI